MPIFEFNVSSGSATGAGILHGTLGPGGPAFTFSFNATTAHGSGSDIVIHGTTLSVATTTFGFLTVSSPVSWSGTFNFTDPLLYFDGFQLNDASFGSNSFTNLSVIATHTTAPINLMLGSNAGFLNVVSFTVSGFGGLSNYLDNVTSNGILCFCAGTRIATPTGSVDVQNLTPGTQISRADGGTTTVRWLGKQTVPARYLHPRRINPIRIAAGALGNGLPLRDLYVSPDHAMRLDGYLVNASALINGTTITQVAQMPLEGFTYYHVETDAHEVILAEGSPTESYLDMPGRDAFDNGAERADAPPIAEMTLPRITARRMLPKPIATRLAPPRTLRQSACA